MLRFASRRFWSPRRVTHAIRQRLETADRRRGNSLERPVALIRVEVRISCAVGVKRLCAWLAFYTFYTDWL